MFLIVCDNSDMIAPLWDIN